MHTVKVYVSEMFPLDSFQNVALQIVAYSNVFRHMFFQTRLSYISCDFTQFRCNLVSLVFVTYIVYLYGQNPKNVSYILTQVRYIDR